MNPKKLNPGLLWMQFEDVLVPRLGLSVKERAVYSYLLRHSLVVGKLRLRFAVMALARTLGLSIGAARQAVRRSGIADQVKLVFVATDPARDTPVQLRRWLDNFDSHFVGLTGTEAALEAVQKAAGVPLVPKTVHNNGNYSIAHANFVIAYTKDNLVAHVIYPGGVSKDDWIHDLPLLINETWSRP